MSTVPTAATTIVPVLQAAGFAFAWQPGRYSCRTGISRLTITKAHGTVAEIQIFGGDSSCEEGRILAMVADALRAAGFNPVWFARGELRVNWLDRAENADRRAA